MGALKIIAAWDVSPEAIQQALNMEQETWVVRKTRTGKATLFTLTSADLGTMYKKAIDLWEQGLIDECWYEVGIEPERQRFCIRRPWQRRWMMALVEPFLQKKASEN